MLIDEIRKRGGLHIVRLRDMQNFFRNIGGCDKNKEVYRVFSIERRYLNYAITIIKPGRVNGEFFMTKGHYHKVPASEVYYCIKGMGLILLQKGNSFRTIRMQQGKFYEIPEGFAHRTVNTGNVSLEFIDVHTTSSGHEYKKIEKEGFKKRIFAK